MTTKQGDVSLLDDPVAQGLLQSRIPARLAYTWTDGSPRVIPIWFHWTGKEVVVTTPSDAPKVKALQQNPQVAITIDDNESPWKVLLIRGTASIEMAGPVTPEYEAAARRYFGEEQGAAWVAQVRGMGGRTARIAIQPSWVGIIDFEQRFPSALERAMEQAQAGA